LFISLPRPYTVSVVRSLAAFVAILGLVSLAGCSNQSDDAKSSQFCDIAASIQQLQYVPDAQQVEVLNQLAQSAPSQIQEDLQLLITAEENGFEPTSTFAASASVRAQINNDCGFQMDVNEIAVSIDQHNHSDSVTTDTIVIERAPLTMVGVEAHLQVDQGELDWLSSISSIDIPSADGNDIFVLTTLPMNQVQLGREICVGALHYAYNRGRTLEEATVVVFAQTQEVLASHYPGDGNGCKFFGPTPGG
jgi:outer membrane murein-binding lipoprotein Lpp